MFLGDLGDAHDVSVLLLKRTPTLEHLASWLWRVTVRRSVLCLVSLISILVSANTYGPPAVAQQVTGVEHVTFETNIIPNMPAKPVVLRALLYVPTQVVQPAPAVVITPSSGGYETTLRSTMRAISLELELRRLLSTVSGRGE